MSKPNEHLLELIRLTQEMMALADEGDRDRIDDSCGIIYGILRDSAYRLRKIAREECEKHLKGTSEEKTAQKTEKQITEESTSAL